MESDNWRGEADKRYSDVTTAPGYRVWRGLSASPLDSMDIKFYAIRQKSTGYFLPHHFQELSGAYTKDDPLPNCMPRPFKTAAAARLALSAWVKGVWKIEGLDEFDYLPLPEPPSVPPLSRQASDMEVVEIRLGSVRPVP